MIKLTRLDGSDIYLNHLNIQWIETNPDTTITVINGARIIVKENLATVLQLIEERIKKENYLSSSDMSLSQDGTSQECISSHTSNAKQKYIMT